KTAFTVAPCGSGCVKLKESNFRRSTIAELAKSPGVTDRPFTRKLNPVILNPPCAAVPVLWKTTLVLVGPPAVAGSVVGIATNELLVVVVVLLSPARPV